MGWGVITNMGDIAKNDLWGFNVKTGKYLPMWDLRPLLDNHF